MSFAEGMGQAVAERTILRKIDGVYETWPQVCSRVAAGNSSLCKTANEAVSEYATIKQFMGKKIMITSGRHLEHGDASQKHKSMEVFTNCSTSFTTFNLLYLLLNGSGVGRSYDDDLMISWDHAPTIVCVLSDTHADYNHLYHVTPREAKHMYDDAVWITCEDSREGWSKIVESIEVMTFEKIHREKVVVVDFSDVRPLNSPIAGMNQKPASGPCPLMSAIDRIKTVKGMPAWKQNLYIDHFFAECVRVGGVRRSARMSTKFWKDSSIFEFIEVKRPVEYRGLSPKEIVEYRKTNKPQAFLWSSNNSILVDAEFWELLDLKKSNPRFKSALARHAREVFKRVVECSYGDGTGEPGLINVDKLEFVENNTLPVTFGSERHRPANETLFYLDHLLRIVKKKTYKWIVNPCAEIVLAIYGAYCTIADLALGFASTEEEMHEAVRATVRFLIRVNSMPSYYDSEVKRTNRIGVGLTGVHEMAWVHFGFTFADLVDEEKSLPFWHLLARLKESVSAEAARYSKLMGMACPETDTTIKPAGTTSKLFGLTEGWHLMPMAFYLRNVQFRSDSPLVADYKKRGYPTRELKTYKNTTIVGFPTTPMLSSICDCVTLADEASPEDQYKWLMLGEKYWIGKKGNQISYTLKYDPSKVTFEEYVKTFKTYQSQVRCCSVMPVEDSSGYEYLPEEAVTRERYNEIVAGIDKTVEDIGIEHIDCGTGGCPISFSETKA